MTTKIKEAEMIMYKYTHDFDIQFICNVNHWGQN